MPLVKSWVASANQSETDFPLNNLPYGVFSTGTEKPCCGVAIGDMILNVSELEILGQLKLADHPVFDAPSWNKLMDLGQAAWAELRARLTKFLSEGSTARALVEPHLIAQSVVKMHMPFRVAEYTDFYAGRNHATNVGTMFRGVENVLPPNWLHIPIGYNGRASSVIV